MGKSDFDGVYGGIEYNQVLMDYVELGVHYDYYSRTVGHVLPRLHVGRRHGDPPVPEAARGAPRRHRPVPADEQEAQDRPLRRRRRGCPLLPVRGVRRLHRFPPSGGECRFDYDVVPDHFVSEGTAFGYHALGGLRVYVNRDIAIVGEGRYQWGKDDMGDDFSPNEPGLVNTIDLSGLDVHGGRARTVLTHRELRDGRPGRVTRLVDLADPLARFDAVCLSRRVRSLVVPHPRGVAPSTTDGPSPASFETRGFHPLDAPPGCLPTPTDRGLL